MKFTKPALAAATLACLAMAPAAQAETPEVPEELREMFRAWILSEPEIIPQAMAILEERQRAERSEMASAIIEQNREIIFDESLPGYGSSDPDALLVLKFSDYQCGFCARAHGELARVVAERPDVRIVVREFPVLGEASMSLAEFALAVHDLAGDDAWSQVHDAAFDSAQGWSMEWAEATAGELGLDYDEVSARMASEEVAMQIDVTRQIAEALNATGTPTFVIGSTVVPGAISAEDMIAIIDAVAVD